MFASSPEVKPLVFKGLTRHEVLEMAIADKEYFGASVITGYDAIKLALIVSKTLSRALGFRYA